MLKMGIIGLGRMGRHHINIYNELQGVKLAAICDVDSSVLEHFAKTKGALGFADYREMLSEVDLVTVAAPTVHHYNIAKDCLNAGKHVLVEKPIATSYAHAEELFHIADQKDLVLHIGHVERFNGAVQELHKLVQEPYLIESRRVGPFVSSVANDSIVLDLMIHDIDIILNIVNSKVTNIQASGSIVHSSLPDIATITLEFENGAVANIIASRVTEKKDRQLAISQKEAYIFLDYTNQAINIYRKGSSQHIHGEQELKYKNEHVREKLFVYKENALKNEIKHFLDCSLNRVKRVVTVEHELRSLKIALRVDKLLLNNCKGGH